VTVVGVCGHQQLGSARESVEGLLKSVVDGFAAPIAGVTSLAVGADQIFGEAVLHRGGSLHAVIPCRGYESTLSGAGLDEYRRLLAAATDVAVLDFAKPSEEAFLAAGRWVAEHCDVLLAVWDGAPSRGLGGTADIVAHAQNLGRDIRVLWPQGSPNRF
jgi:hypothetical protein